MFKPITVLTLFIALISGCASSRWQRLPMAAKKCQQFQQSHLELANDTPLGQVTLNALVKTCHHNKQGQRIDNPRYIRFPIFTGKLRCTKKTIQFECQKAKGFGPGEKTRLNQLQKGRISQENFREYMILLAEKQFHLQLQKLYQIENSKRKEENPNIIREAETLLEN